MGARFRWSGLIALVALMLAPLQAATVSRQNAETFAKKLVQIRQQGGSTQKAAPALRRTPVSEDELNSWFTYSGQSYIPPGVSQPQLTLVGNGKVSGTATVDLEAIGKRRSTGGTFDPWSYLGGRVPVTVEGILHTQNGRGRFEVQSAEVSGLPVPKAVLQELVSYYSRTDQNPAGINLDAQFPLPAGIRQIELGQGQAVVIQ